VGALGLSLVLEGAQPGTDLVGQSPEMARYGLPVCGDKTGGCKGFG